MNELSVAELRKKKYKVEVHHSRVTTERHRFGGISEEIEPRGGVTHVRITTPDGEELKGVARCSLKDNYNKRLGVKIALGRALKNHKF